MVSTRTTRTKPVPPAQNATLAGALDKSAALKRGLTCLRIARPAFGKLAEDSLLVGEWLWSTGTNCGAMLDAAIALFPADGLEPVKSPRRTVLERAQGTESPALQAWASVVMEEAASALWEAVDEFDGSVGEILLGITRIAEVIRSDVDGELNRGVKREPLRRELQRLL